MASCRKCHNPFHVPGKLYPLCPQCAGAGYTRRAAVVQPELNLGLTPDALHGRRVLQAKASKAARGRCPKCGDAGWCSDCIKVEVV